METRRIPAAVLVALGLAGCGPEVGDDDDGASSESTATSGANATHTATTATDVDTSACLDVGPCLKYDIGSYDTGATTMEGSTGTGTGSTTGGTADTGEPTTGPCLAPPGGVVPDDGLAPAVPQTRPSSPDGREAASRTDIIERLRAADVLPPDVARRLRGDDGQGG